MLCWDEIDKNNFRPFFHLKLITVYLFNALKTSEITGNCLHILKLKSELLNSCPNDQDEVHPKPFQCRLPLPAITDSTNRPHC